MLKKMFRFLITVIILLAVVSAAACYAFGRLFPLEHYDLIEKYSSMYGLDPGLVCAVINTESHFNTGVSSGKGARGLMQIMEETADWVAAKMELKDYSFDNINDPELNIQIGCWLLSHLKSMYEDENTALAAYNAGLGNVNKWLEDPMYSGDRIHLNNIPFKETADYVKRVELNRKVYDYIIMLRSKSQEIKNEARPLIQ